MKSRSSKRKLTKVWLSTLLCIAVAAIMLLPMMLGNTSAASAASNYGSDYDSKAEAVAAGDELNERIASEGMVLLKNEGNALPVKTRYGSGSARVTLFGTRSFRPFGGGNGNETGDASAGTTTITKDIYQSLREANFITNPIVEAQYRAWDEEYYSKTTNSWGQTVEVTASEWLIVKDLVAAGKTASAAFQERLSSQFKASYANYSDAAIVVLSATASSTANEGRKMAEAGAIPTGDQNAHAYQLDSAQLALLEEVYAGGFDKVIVLINDSRPMELGFLDDSNVDAAVLIGEPGANGFNILGDLLNGNINPSGRLVDIYAREFHEDPTFFNYGQNFRDNGAVYTTDGATPTLRAGAGSVDYAENIYIGYRYYETRGFMENDSDAWYDNHVVYPFGYGLSYTDFDWEIVDKPSATQALTLDTKISIKVKVTNTGSVAGKDVVELYYTAPYGNTATAIEKSHVVLGDFAKTKLLESGESQIVTVSLDAQDMASYDWKKSKVANGGYILEAGDYQLKLMTNSHELKADDMFITYNAASDIICRDSKITGYEIKNQFDDVNSVILGTSTTITSLAAKGQVSRFNFAGTIPTAAPTADDMKISDADFAHWDLTGGVAEDAENNYLPASYDVGKPWTVTTPTKFADAATRPEKAAVVLPDMIGRNYSDPMWETLLDQITLDEAINLINNGGFGTIALPYIEKPSSIDTDGPQGWSGNGIGGSAMSKFASEPVVASTWNKQLAYELGYINGQQGMWGNSDGGIGVRSYTGWYAPAMNTHRSPWDSRYKEYYSEDGVLAGMIAAYTSKGARDTGCYIYIKHFALHEDGGTLRGTMMQVSPAARSSGLAIWCNEQAMREIYFKPFQLAVEVGGAMAAMSSFSRIGYTWAGGSYALQTELLRNEWGFEGMVITDIEIYSFTNAQQMIRAGGDLNLSSGYINPAFTRLRNDPLCNTPTQLAAIRQAAKNILYVVANSNTMQIPQGSAIRYNEKLLAGGTVGTAYTNSLLSTAVTGEGAQGFNFNTQYTGYSELAFNITNGSLPTGLSLDGKTGAITGTPTEAGTFAFDVEVTAKGYISASASLSIKIAGAKLGAPGGLKAENGKLTWTAVEGASGYIVEVDGVQYNVATTSYKLGALDEGDYVLKVSAIGAGNYTNSDFAETTYKVEAQEDKGCGSIIGVTSAVTAAAVLLAGALAIILIRKKSKD